MYRKDSPDEIDFYLKRLAKGPDYVFVAKDTKFKDPFGVEFSKRAVRKIANTSENNEFVIVDGQFGLRCTPAGRDQIKVVVYNNEPSDEPRFTLQKFHYNGQRPTSYTNFTFKQGEFMELLEFLSLVRFVDFSVKDNFQATLSNLRNRVLVERSDSELIQSLKQLHGTERLQLLERLKSADLTKEDLDILSGRKDGLEVFRKKLYDERDWDELKWQDFFESNQWIFGYGLDYRFLRILQREAAISDTDLDGTNTVFGDFLTGSSDFTVLVELKRPDTPLFGAARKRARAWELSRDLLDAVSQILAQKAAWQVKSTRANYADSGQLIEQRTHDPKCLLIIGSKVQFSGTDREKAMKYETFELFRRDSRNIEILTFDELFERAYFLVNQKQAGQNGREQEAPQEYDDDIPF